MTTVRRDLEDGSALEWDYTALVARRINPDGSIAGEDPISAAQAALWFASQVPVPTLDERVATVEASVEQLDSIIVAVLS